MNDSQKPVNNSDEIDLGQLFSKIGDFFKNIGLGFMRFLSLLRRVPLENKTLFILLMASALIVGFSYSNFLKKKFYATTMILSSEYLNKRILDNSIDKLNLLAQEETKRGLALELSISDSLAENIYEFAAKPFIKETDLIELEVLKEQLKNLQADKKNEKVVEQVIGRIEIENRHAFEITVKVFTPTVINQFQLALIKYFRDNEYIKKRVEIRRTNLLDRKTKLGKEMQKLDSLKAVIYSNYKNMAEQARQGSNNVILSDKAVTNPIDIYNQDINIYRELQDIDRQLYLQQDFELVDGFTEFSEPASASKSKIIAISLLVAFVLGYVLIALIQFNKYLAKLT